MAVCTYVSTPSTITYNDWLACTFEVIGHYHNNNGVSCMGPVVLYYNIYWPSPSNLSFYRQIAGHHRGVGDHKGRPMMRGGHGPIRQLQDLNWGAFDHASHAPQLRSCNYNMLARLIGSCKLYLNVKLWNLAYNQQGREYQCLKPIESSIESGRI